MAMIKKKVMGKPMKKAQVGTVIPENPDQADQLNRMEAERQAKLKKAKGVIINPQIRRQDRRERLAKQAEDRGDNMKPNMSRTPMKKGGMIKKSKMGGAMAKQAATAIAMKKAGKTPKKK